MIDNRSLELSAINYIIDQIPTKNVIRLSSDCHIEGGDVILCNDHVFIGIYTGEDYSNYITARTNINAVNALREIFPNKTIKTLSYESQITHQKTMLFILIVVFSHLVTTKQYYIQKVF